jgi:oxaloacetate decarboxylase beta subunit
MGIVEILQGIWEGSGVAALTYKEGIMIGFSFLLLTMAIVKKYEPLLLLPIAFGMLLANLPEAGLMAEAAEGAPWYTAGVLRLLYMGVKSSLFPCIFFLGVGAMTDFGPMLANPVSLLLGAAAQLGIYAAFIISILLGYSPAEAASIGIIGGADGPTAIFLTGKLAPHLLAPIAIAAYSYMALSTHSTADYARADHKKGTRGQDGPTAQSQ